MYLTNKKNHALTDHIVSLGQHKGKIGQSGIELLLLIDERQIPENTPAKFSSPKKSVEYTNHEPDSVGVQDGEDVTGKHVLPFHVLQLKVF